MRRRIYIIGIDHVIGKLVYLYDTMRDRYAVEPIYFTSDSSGFSKEYSLSSAIHYCSRLSAPFKIPWHLALHRPVHVEIYLSRLSEVIIAGLASFVFSIPVVVVCRGSDLRGWESHRTGRKIVTTLVLRQAKLVLLKELYMRELIVEHRLCRTEKLVDIHNSVPAALLRQDKFDPQSNTFVFLNSFHPMRNVDVLLRAFRVVTDHRDEARLKLIGSTIGQKGFSPFDEAHERALMALVDQLQIAPYVEILPFRPAAWTEVRAALAFVLPADVVWLNNALLEAMAYGIPPIVSDTRGVDRIIEHRGNGLICMVEPEALAEQLIFSLNHRSDMIKMSRNAKVTIQERFLTEGCAESLVSEYECRVWARR